MCMCVCVDRVYGAKVRCARPKAIRDWRPQPMENYCFLLLRVKHITSSLDLDRVE